MTCRRSNPIPLHSRSRRSCDPNVQAHLMSTKDYLSPLDLFFRHLSATTSLSSSRGAGLLSLGSVQELQADKTAEWGPPHPPTDTALWQGEMQPPVPGYHITSEGPLFTSPLQVSCFSIFLPTWGGGEVISLPGIHSIKISRTMNNKRCFCSCSCLGSSNSCPSIPSSSKASVICFVLLVPLLALLSSQHIY